jgi:hypothetical protein
MTEEELLSLFGTVGPWSVLFPSAGADPLVEGDMAHLLGLYRGELIPVNLLVSLSPAGVSIRLLVGDKSGRVLTSLRPDIRRVSWRFNALGQLSFALARTDEKLQEHYLRFGNRILLQFDNGLPPWGGVIGGTYDWNDAEVVFQAISGEALLFRRLTARQRRFDDATVGAIALALLTEADAIAPTGVRPGRIWSGGQGHFPEYHYKSLGDALHDSLVENLSAESFDVSAREEAGTIVFELNLYGARGERKTNIALVENQNVADVRFRVEDTIVNAWVMAGEGSDWGDDDRVYAEAIDEESIRLYGRREDFEVRSGAIYQSTLDETIAKRLDETAYPTRVLGVAATDDAPARFSDYGVGDSILCVLPSYDWNGLRGLYRVLDREFLPDEGVTDLVLEEVR